MVLPLRADTVGASPTLKLRITPEQHQRAVESSSGGCLIAEAIKEQYPHLSSISVDTATIRCSDREKGVRYTYLTPPAAQEVLLSFDQGWEPTFGTVTVKPAVNIVKIIGNSTAERAAQREERLKYLNDKLASGEPMTQAEKGALSRLTNPKLKPLRERPTTRGPIEQVIDRKNGPSTVIGGQPLPYKGRSNPNVLRGHNRLFGAKKAEPGRVLNKAVKETEQAAAERVQAAEERVQTAEERIAELEARLKELGDE